VGKTYNNEINEIEVSLAVQRLLIAEYPTAWTPARVDLASLPSGFFDLGAVVEDSPNFTASRGKFQLQAGIPAVLQFEAVTGLEGTFEIALHSNSWRKVQFGLGNVSAISSTTDVATIASVTDRNTITFADTTDLDSLPVGRQIVIAAVSADYDNADATETRISSILSDGVAVKLSPTPIATPTANDIVGFYQYVESFIGTSQLRNHVLLAVADFIDGSQVVHQFYKVSPGDEFNEVIGPTENERIPLSFNAYGVAESAVPGLGGKSELVIARRLYFPTLAAC
jgi:hypothetical protein